MSERFFEALNRMEAYGENLPFTSEIVHYFGISETRKLTLKLDM